MNQNDQNTGTKRKPKRNLFKTLLLIAVIIIAAVLVRNYMTKPAEQQPTAARPQQQIPHVVVRTVGYTEAAAKNEYIGKVEALRTVDLRAQVSGEITGVHFKEGSYVKAGQLLFSIDRSSYAAAVEAANADIARAQAAYDKASRYYERLKKADEKSVSAAALDAAEGDVLQGKAAIAQAKAALQIADINLKHTKITAPISGRIGKAVFTKGNIVSPASGKLATIVSTDPARVAFAMPDREYLNQLKLFKENKGSLYKTTLRLANGDLISAQGKRDFEDNQIDPGTGTMTMRLLFDNSDGRLIPGSMVRIEITPTENVKKLAISLESVITDHEGDFVYTVDGNSVAQHTRIELGAELGKMVEVKSGLSEGDKVIEQGLQMVRPGVKVNAFDIENDLAPAAASPDKAPAPQQQQQQ